MRGEQTHRPPKAEAAGRYLDTLGGSDAHPEDLQALIDGLRATDGPLDPAEVPPPAENDEVMVVRSMRMPAATWDRLKAAAADRGVPMSTLARQWIEIELAALEDDRPISRADAIRALAGVPPLGGAA